MSGGTIFDGSCVCEAPIECRFNLGKLFVEQTKEPDDTEFDSIESQTALFPDVKHYINQVWSE